MKNKSKLKTIVMILGITFTFLAFNNFNLINDQGNREEKREIYDKTNLKLTASNITILSPEEMSYSAPMSGYYPATFGFENDQIGNSPEGWSIILNNAGTCQVIEDHSGHKNVVELFDNVDDYGRQVRMNDDIEPRGNGQVEFWVRFDTNTHTRAFRLYNGSSMVLNLFWKLGNVSYNDGTDIVITPYSANKWYHIRVKFDLGYNGDGTNNWHLWIDGVSMDQGFGYGYVTPASEVNQTSFQTGTRNGENFYYYIDAVGYSWDPNYHIGDNLNEGLLLKFAPNNFDWMRYSLDGQNNRTILGNTTFPMPDQGVHSIQVFANGSLGSVLKSDIRYFCIDIIGSPIEIDGTNKLKDWFYISYFYDWCSGSGTVEDPYIIEDVSIDGGGIGIGIFVGNTRKYFEIKNCFIQNCEIGIKIVNATNLKIFQNTIFNIKGLNGLPYGQNGNEGGGVVIKNSNYANISLNNIYDIFGGNGAIGYSSTYAQKGGNGNIAYGILISNSIDAVVFSNHISNIFGGDGGNGGNGADGRVHDYYSAINGYPGALGGKGGIGAGIYFEDSINIANNRNIIKSIYGGRGGDGGNGGAGGSIFLGYPNSEGGNGEAGGPGGAGGLGLGIYFKNITRIINKWINIENIAGGSGGNGGNGGNGGGGTVYGGNGGVGSIGGTGGLGSGICFEDSIDVTNDWNKIFNVFAGSGGNGGDGGKGGIGCYTGGDGGRGGLGGVGGNAALGSGIYSMNSINIINFWNDIETIVGASGGDGGNGGNGGAGYYLNGRGGNGASGNTGGSGGYSIGLYLDTSRSINNSWNSIMYIISGIGGDGGQRGSGGTGYWYGSYGNNGQPGINGKAFGFMLDNSNDTMSYLNSIFCQNNTDDGSYNYWDNGFIGNYWSYYSGVDTNPQDAIGDDPYILNGSAGSKDNYPFMFECSADFDGDSLNNFEEYMPGIDGYITNITNPDTDSDSFNDGIETSLNTNPIDPLWYPMPNLKVSHFSSIITHEKTSFMLDFSVSNNGIWKAEGVIIIVRCEELDLTLFNNSNSPLSLNVDETEYIAVNCPPIDQTGIFTLNLTIDPYNNIAETYSSKDGSARIDAENDNSQTADLLISAKSSVVPPAVPGYSLFILIGICSLISIVLIRKCRK